MCLLNIIKKYMPQFMVCFAVKILKITQVGTKLDNIGLSNMSSNYVILI